MELHLTEYGCVTYQMGSHSVTCHPTQVNILCVNTRQIDRYRTRFTYPRGTEGWVDLVKWPLCVTAPDDIARSLQCSLRPPDDGARCPAPKPNRRFRSDCTATRWICCSL